jgi:1-acyl-sn-glycerol-3-phosphate acyltransferase
LPDFEKDIKSEPILMPTFFKQIKPAVDLILTLIYWTYFTLGYVIFFLPLYLWAAFFSKNHEQSFQKLNHLFYKGFFGLVKYLTPGLAFDIDEKVLSVRSSLIVCNHISYLDPILLISLYEKQKTIVRNRFFKLPVFGWVLKQSGYMPSAADSKLSGLMLQQVEKMQEYLASGGNFFVFPEGTRSRDGNIGKFEKGLFKIAGRFHVPIKVFFIQNSNRLFCPGKFLFNTCTENIIKLKFIGEITLDKEGKMPPVADMIEMVRSMMETKNKNIGKIS